MLDSKQALPCLRQLDAFIQLQRAELTTKLNNGLHVYYILTVYDYLFLFCSCYVASGFVQVSLSSSPSRIAGLRGCKAMCDNIEPNFGEDDLDPDRGICLWTFLPAKIRRSLQPQRHQFGRTRFGCT